MKQVPQSVFIPSSPFTRVLLPFHLPAAYFPICPTFLPLSLVFRLSDTALLLRTPRNPSAASTLSIWASMIAIHLLGESSSQASCCFTAFLKRAGFIPCSSSCTTNLPAPFFQAPPGPSSSLRFFSQRYRLRFPVTIATLSHSGSYSPIVNSSLGSLRMLWTFISSATRFTRATFSRLVRIWTSVRFPAPSKYCIDKVS